MPLRILSYNLNGIRSAMSKGLVEWLSTKSYDIVCFQETKAQPDQVDNSAFETLGYQTWWHSAEKKGYSGVAIYSKIVPDFVQTGMGFERYDKEGRVIRADFGELTILNCYFPSGTTGDIRQDIKMDFLKDFFQFVQDLRQIRPNLIVVGDYNIAHNEIDIHNPKSNQNSSGFLPEERAWMTKWLDSGFIDTFRACYPEKEAYSWWSFRANSRANNKGWRIDYQSISSSLQSRLLDAGHHNEVTHSDHCGVFMELSD